MDRRTSAAAVVIFACVGGLGAGRGGGRAWALPPIFKIADTGTVAPGGGTFVGFGVPISVERQHGPYRGFAFAATSSAGVNGVYVGPDFGKGLIAVADTSQVAATGGTFASFASVSGGWGEGGFIGTDSNGKQGVYLWEAGVFSPILIATSDASPVPGATFGNFHGISMMAHYITSGLGGASGAIVSDSGVYVAHGSAWPFVFPVGFGRVASTSTVPGGASGPFTSFGGVSYKGVQTHPGTEAGRYNSYLAVRAAAGGVEAIYLDIGEGSLVAAGDPLPDGTGHFTSFGDPVVTDSELTFTARSSTAAGGEGQGIFSYGSYFYRFDVRPYPPTLEKVVGTGEAAPDSGGAVFSGFADVTDTSSGQVFVAGLSDGTEGLFVRASSASTPRTLFRVIGTGDLFEGRRVAEIELSAEGSTYENGPFTFKLGFEDGAEGVYWANIADVVAVPEPAVVGWCGVAVLLLRGRRRK